MATYAWEINRLYAENITKDGTTYTDVIARVEATLVGTSEIDSSIKDGAGWDIDLDTDNIGSDFTPYASVTESEVDSWLEARIGTEAINEAKQAMVQQIEYLEKVRGASPKEDSEGNPTFPWS